MTANFLADCDTIYNVKVTYTVSESAVSAGVPHGQDEVTVCVLLYSALSYSEDRLLLC